MLDTKRLLDQFVGAGGSAAGSAAGAAKGFIGDGGSFAKGAVAGGLLGLMVGNKKSRKFAKKAATYGGVALVGGLAYKAYKDYKAGQAVPPPPTAHQAQPQALPPPPQDSGFAPATPAAEQSLSRAMLRAMIAAAKADGHIDAQEQANIFAKMDALPLDADDKAFVMDELRAPLDVEAVAAGAQSPEQAAEIYAASLLAIDPDSPAERGYLGMLAARLGLEQGLVDHLHASVAGGAPLPGRTSVEA